MELQIRLLGPVEVFTGGQDVTPGGAKRRAVLAGLALEANRPVSLTRLAGMVWSDVPPASAVANLRSHVAALRRTVGPRLIARPQAYELQLTAHELDVTEFQRLAGEGRAMLATHDPVGAIGRLGSALAQWRGACGDGLPRGTALDNRWASLDEQRLQVFEELAEARLAAGQHAQMLAELRGHVAAHPLRERAWAQLMLVLYRCGDVPAALAVYQDARAVFSEQLGIEPGGELTGLHRAVLDRAPELSWTTPAGPAVVPAAPAEVGPSVGWAVPRELPADLVTFVARPRETADVVAALRGPAPAAVVVTGAAGSGKTALAVRAAHQVAADFPDGQVFVDLDHRTAVTPGEVLARVLRALGVPAAEVPENADERAGWFRSMVAGRRLLVVVDGVTRAAQVRALLPAGTGPALIAVASRRLGSLDGVRRVTLRPLGVAQARDLLATIVGRQRLTADGAAMAELVGLCAGSVLALRVAGARLARWPAMPVAALVAQLGDDRHRLDLLADEDLSVRASLASTVAAVRAEDELAGPILALLGAHPDTPDLVDRAATQLGVSTQRIRRALDSLVDAHLLAPDGSAGHRLPALVREYLAELAAVPATPPYALAGPRINPVAA
ncbi:AfsR/SARP family transcriptional regulator [Micromonospora eburnea]|uniref:DNA-binding transcriptional activator of the SARP family n=1 Tax=Micromonospora eburnea TaxID=227316 RepID=A0A1C6UAS8_9ACTN|nr:AfsR/SARP family transcriptional regulator [Micromonospora eburnea]SCL51142.1 DNA-binding transcriptional activator of the SARP family [Micromonospora eburnea]